MHKTSGLRLEWLNHSWLLMSPLTWFDNRTLFGCQCMLATLFAIAFLWLRHTYPRIRGVRQVTWGFLLGIPCAAIMMMQGYLAPFLSVTLANLLALAVFLCLYDGTVRFLGARSYVKVLAGLSVISLGVTYFFSDVRPNVVPRIVAMGLICAAIRGTTAWALLERSEYDRAMRLPDWGARELLGSFLVLLVVICLQRVAVIVVQGVPKGFIEQNSIQTSTMALNVLFIAVSGLCFLVMASQDLIARSQEESEKDSLSGAWNRRGIEAKLTQELKRCNRSRQRLSIALVDIDRFKTINDTHGHTTGDIAIRETARAMGTRLREIDYLGRYGGDEFLVVLPLTVMENAAIVAERLSEAVTGLNVLRDGQRLTLSIGLTEASPDDDAITLIARADEALYQAKSAGRDCIRVVAPLSTFPETSPGYSPRVSAES